MIYFSRAFDRMLLEVHHHQVRGIMLGEHTPKLYSAFIPTCKQAGRSLIGLRHDLCIGSTYKGRTRINNVSKTTPNGRHLFLSCRPDNPDNNICRILAPAEQPLNIKGYGYSLDDRWYDAIFAVEPGDVFAVITGDTMQRYREQCYYIVDKTNVYAVHATESANTTYAEVLNRLGQTRPHFDSGLQPWRWSDVLLRQHAGINIVRART